MKGEIYLKGITIEEFISIITDISDPDRLMTPQEVRTELNISKSTYSRLVKKGDIPVRGSGTLERVLKSELFERFKPIKKST